MLYSLQADSRNNTILKPFFMNLPNPRITFLHEFPVALSENFNGSTGIDILLFEIFNQLSWWYRFQLIDGSTKRVDSPNLKGILLTKRRDRSKIIWLGVYIEREGFGLNNADLYEKSLKNNAKYNVCRYWRHQV